MRALRWLPPTLLAVVSLLAVSLVEKAAAQEGPHWLSSLDDAEKLAMQSHKLVLVHFWATWCGPCRALEGNVFSQPGVGQAMESRFVPVKVNVVDFPATARLYEIEFYPTDVIITPSGRVIAKLKCPQDPRQYVAQLMQYAPPVQQPNAYAQAPMAPATAPPSYQPAPSYQQPPANPRSDAASGMSMYSSHDPALPGPADAGPPAYSPAPVAAPSTSQYAAAPQNPAPENPVPSNPVPQNPVPPDPTPVTQVTAQQPAPPQMASQSAPPAASSSRPPLGLDGYCPVTLIERHHETPADARCWVQGNPRWGIVHRGTVYLFVGPDELKRFMADPDRYSPALSGNDPVLAFDQGRLQQGTRQFGTFFGDRIYLFTSAENLAKFAQSRDVASRYAEEVRQAETNSRGSMH
jgi:protein disulfide-isomerase